MNETYNWYSTLQKPSWAPPVSLFGQVWSVLYLIIFVTYGFIFYKIYTKQLPTYLLLPLLLNLFFNFIFTPIQFGLRNNYLATLDISLVLATLIWTIIAIYKYFPIVSLANIPYLLWVTIATVLQFSITWLNR